MAHWTYQEFAAGDDLQQGDILRPNDDLRNLFEEVHPHFVDSKYLGFIITSQSCDLAQRNSHPCSTHYINVAVVRSLAAVFRSLLESVCEPIHDGVYKEKEKGRATELLSRIYNQNEQKLGLFYLYPDASVEFGEDAVAFLRVSVAVRREHYALLQSARCGRLSIDFANKLGWLVGNLYSRIGTKDWPTRDLSTKTRDFLRRIEEVVWIPEATEKHIRDSKKGHLTRSEFLELAQVKVPTPKEKGMERIVDIIEGVVPTLDPRVIEKLKGRLISDQVLGACFKLS